MNDDERERRQEIAERANKLSTLAQPRHWQVAPPHLSADSSREAVTKWLQWCDPNGSHTDELARAEDADPYTEENAWDALDAMLEDS